MQLQCSNHDNEQWRHAHTADTDRQHINNTNKML